MKKVICINNKIKNVGILKCIEEGKTYEVIGEFEVKHLGKEYIMYKINEGNFLSLRFKDA